jgi:putative polyketide hydroxylase
MAAVEAGARPPVVIVGAGPAGLVAAVTLARAGVGSLLVERNPVLLRHLERLGRAEVRFGTELVALDQDPDGVTVTLRDRATGEGGTARAAYVVGADGAHSAVRRLLGIAMAGPEHLNEQLSVLFEAPLAGLVGGRRHGIYFIRHPEAGGVLVPNGAGDRWLYGRGWDPARERLETTPTSAWPASSAPPPACPTCRSGSWPRGRSRSRPRSPTATGGAGRSWSATPPSG